MKKLVSAFLVLFLLLGSAFAEGVQPGSYVTFGSYPQGADGEVQLIEWLVLEVQDGRAFLVSRFGLDVFLFNNRTGNEWENCSLRYWLNDTFLNTAFTAEEQAYICVTDVDNSASQAYDFSADNKRAQAPQDGNTTQDRLFILSYAEANRYFGIQYKDSTCMASRLSPTAYAATKANFDIGYKTEDGAVSGSWWLRSPGGSAKNAEIVYSDGALNASGVTGSLLLRPALWADVSALSF